MAPDPVTVERVYSAIKTGLLECAIAPGAHLDINRLADAHRVSATPVREALNRLLAERLLVFRRGAGFHAVRLDATELRQLYVWNGLATDGIIRLAIERDLEPPRSTEARARNLAGRSDYAFEASRLFERVAALVRMNEIVLAVSALNDRLYAVRRAESAVLADAWGELTVINGLYETRALSELLAAMIRYHRRREAEIMAIVDQMAHMNMK